MIPTVDPAQENVLAALDVGYIFAVLASDVFIFRKRRLQGGQQGQLSEQSTQPNPEATQKLRSRNKK